MKTEMKKAYIWLTNMIGFYDPKLEITFSDIGSTETFSRVPLTEVEVMVPVLSEDDKKRLMAGETLNSLEKQKNLLQSKLREINCQIQELRAIEYKGDDHE